MTNAAEVVASMPAPGWLRRLDDGSGTRLDLRAGSDVRIQRQLREWYAPPSDTWLRMNMLGTLNARIVGADGTSDTLSNRADRRILATIRAQADAIVVGAGTLRGEAHLSTAPQWLCVVTSSGNLTGHRISPEVAEASVLVLGPEPARHRAEETLPGARFLSLTADNRDLSAEVLLFALHAHGFHQLVIEGGATLVSQFLDAGLVDECCLTQAPTFGPADAPALPGSTRATPFRRELLLDDERGFIYQRLFAVRS